MTETLIAALVAAVVSLLVSLLMHAAEKRKVESEERKQQREMRRRLTERLLDLRLVSYPKAFVVTDKLRGDLILTKGNDVSVNYVKGVLQELLDWQRDYAGFLFTRDSLRAYRALRAALSVEPENGGSYTRKQREQMFRCKNRFRGILKSDLTLLYHEDNIEQEDALDGE